jgi:hypothetical protein
MPSRKSRVVKTALCSLFDPDRCVFWAKFLSEVSKKSRYGVLTLFSCIVPQLSLRHCGLAVSPHRRRSAHEKLALPRVDFPRTEN